MTFEVKNKVFFITGAAAGIGADVVRLLVKEDAKHVAVFDIDDKNGIALQNELNSKFGKKVKFIKGDVTNESQFKGAYQAVKEEQGYLDVLINNAGIMNDSWETYQKQIQINVTALVAGTLNALKVMRKDEGGKGGTIINVSSVAALCQEPMLPVYWGTKSAVLQFSNCIGSDAYYSQTDVRVITICFGQTSTGLVDRAKSFDKRIENLYQDIFAALPNQTSEVAARGLVDAYKQGDSGSTWMVASGRPARDISHNVKKAYEILSEGVYE